MNRGTVGALLLSLTVAGGCASPAQFVEKKQDSGIVAIPDNSNSWPGYNRREALALIQQHVGPNYEILDERKVVTGQTTRNEQQTNTEQTANRRNPALPGERQTTTGMTTTQDVTQWQITYRKLPDSFRPQPFINDINNRGTTIGLTPAGGPAAGVAPSVLPAGGTPRTGTSNYLSPGVRPAVGADCDH